MIVLAIIFLSVVEGIKITQVGEDMSAMVDDVLYPSTSSNFKHHLHVEHHLYVELEPPVPYDL